MPASNPLSCLNPRQREAAETTEGPLLVLAGAGTGKTHTVIERIAQILERGVDPACVLAVTFTNKAAGEMKERLARRMGASVDLSEMIASTFHSLCVKILRRNASDIGFRPWFTIVDQGEQYSLVRKASRHVAGVGGRPGDWLAEISRLKSQGLGPQDVERQATEDAEMALAAVYRRYQESLRRMNALDFDDLLGKAVNLLETHEEARSYWQTRCRYIVVDEFQDTSAIQYRLVEILAAKHGNVCVVGDDDQSIYSWRGAVPENILKFDQRFPGARVVYLEENYRSVNSVLKAANAVIANNNDRHPKVLWSSLGEGEPVRWWMCEDQQDEAQQVVSDIRGRIQHGASPSDFAIILRTNSQTRPFEAELMCERIPYVVLGGQSFFDRKEVRDVVSYLSAIANPKDEASLLRIINTPGRGLGEKSIEALAKWAGQTGKMLNDALMSCDEVQGLSEKARSACSRLAGLFSGWRKRARGAGLRHLVDELLEAIEYRSEVEGLYADLLEQDARMNAAREVGDSLRAYAEKESEPTLYGFLQDAALLGKEYTSKENQQEAAQGVRIITMHSAKGLEYPYVYIGGVEDGLIPHGVGEGVEPSHIEEERRLFYVAMTRARRELTLCTCEGRVQRGKRVEREPSRFLGEIPPEMLSKREALVGGEEASGFFAEILANLESVE